MLTRILQSSSYIVDLKNISFFPKLQEYLIIHTVHSKELAEFYIFIPQLLKYLIIYAVYSKEPSEVYPLIPISNLIDTYLGATV